MIKVDIPYLLKTGEIACVESIGKKKLVYSIDNNLFSASQDEFFDLLEKIEIRAYECGNFRRRITTKDKFFKTSIIIKIDADENVLFSHPTLSWRGVTHKPQETKSGVYFDVSNSELLAGVYSIISYSEDLRQINLNETDNRGSRSN